MERHNNAHLHICSQQDTPVPKQQYTPAPKTHLVKKKKKKKKAQDDARTPRESPLEKDTPIMFGRISVNNKLKGKKKSRQETTGMVCALLRTKRRT